jgi:phosphomethylpyrimidine synthase
MSRARKSFDWERVIGLSLDPEKAKAKRGEVVNDHKKCRMCGEFCAMRQTQEDL